MVFHKIWNANVQISVKKRYGLPVHGEKSEKTTGMRVIIAERGSCENQLVFLMFIIAILLGYKY